MGSDRKKWGHLHQMVLEKFESETNRNEHKLWRTFSFQCQRQAACGGFFADSLVWEGIRLAVFGLCLYMWWLEQSAAHEYKWYATFEIARECGSCNRTRYHDLQQLLQNLGKIPPRASAYDEFLGFQTFLESETSNEHSKNLHCSWWQSGFAADCQKLWNSGESSSSLSCEVTSNSFRT